MQAKLLLDSPSPAAAAAAAAGVVHQGAITSSGSSPGNESHKNESDSLPISDNNVSTTNADTLMDEAEWENDADINVSFVYSIFTNFTKISRISRIFTNFTNFREFHEFSRFFKKMIFVSSIF